MKRIILSIVWGLLTGWAAVPCLWAQSRTGTADREIWVKTLVRLADPVLSNLANETLKKEMPYESLAPNRQRFSYLEAVGRTVCGIAPWLELGEDDTPEGQLRKKYIELTVKGISNAVNPSSPDYLIFGEPSQPLVDAAFLAEGLLRAPKQLWGNLSPTARKQVVTELKRSRVIKPNESNWLLFASIVEAALQEFTGECDTTRLNYGVRKFRDLWYKGDAQYGDGAEFHLDYYNSFVIHPMYIEALEIITEAGKREKIGNMPGCNFHEAIRRAQRFGVILERLISPEGTLPVFGRSITYRTGSLQTLALLAWRNWLPEELSNGQVRAAMTAVIQRMFGDGRNFNTAGFLTLGFNGSQPGISDYYTNNGSLYMASLAFLPLGLSADDPFWTDASQSWTSKKAWEGEEFPKDHSYHKE